ncbi:MAG: hypothetical protein AAF724_06445 [Pseudomonadota bacterium]
MTEPPERTSVDGSAIARFFQAVERSNHVFRIAPAYAFRSLRGWITGNAAEKRQIRAVERDYEDRAIGPLDIAELTTAFYDGYKADERFERIQHDERRKIAHLSDLVSRGIIRRQRELREEDESVMALRAQHAKHHGCVRARFIVETKLADEYSVGVFQPGQIYDATLRFSNAHGSRRPDREGDGRGLAIKLNFGEDQRPGSPIAERWGLTGVGNHAEQDFLLTDFPVFFVDDITEYDRFLTITESNNPSWLIAIRFILFFVPMRIRKGLSFFRLFRNKIDSTLNNAYHSMSPYLFGKDKVVRYLVKPTSLEGPATGVSSESADFLRERMAIQLAPGSNGSSGAEPVATFDFCIQIRANPSAGDVERASRAWRDEKDRTVRLGRIEIPPQEFDTQSCEYRCQNLVFSPWNCIEMHRPIGGINRSRLLVYFISATLRRRMNMVERAD